jgi:hypothetical protein
MISVKDKIHYPQCRVATCKELGRDHAYGLFANALLLPDSSQSLFDASASANISMRVNGVDRDPPEKAGRGRCYIGSWELSCHHMYGSYSEL